MPKDIRMWNELIGNSNQKYFLMNALERNVLPHFILFTGGYGTGKSTMANLVAKSILCEEGRKGSEAPCGECVSCLNFDRKSNPSFVKVNIPEMNGKADIKDIINNIFRFEKLSDRTVFVLEEIHGKDKSTTDIQRALLDVLSSIPDDVYVLSCTTRPYEVLPELVNRAYVVELDIPTTKDCELFIGRLCGEYNIYIADSAVVTNLAEACDHSLRQIAEVLRVVATNNALTSESLGKMFKFAKDEKVLKFLRSFSNEDNMYKYIQNTQDMFKDSNVRSLIKRSVDFTYEHIIRLATSSVETVYSKDIVKELNDIFRDKSKQYVSTIMATLGGLSISDKEAESKKLSKLIDAKLKLMEVATKQFDKKKITITEREEIQKVVKDMAVTSAPVEETNLFGNSIGSNAELQRIISDGKKDAR